MTTFDHNFKRSRIIAQLVPKRCESQSKQKNCYFSKFLDIPTVFGNHPNTLPQSNTIKRCRQICKHRLFLFRPALLAQKNCEVAAGCGSYDKLSDLYNPHKTHQTPKTRPHKTRRLGFKIKPGFMPTLFHARLFIDTLWSPTGKELTSWLSFVMSNSEFVTFP